MHEGIRPKVNPPVMREAPAAQPNLPQRPNRKPFGSMQLKLSHEIRPGFHGHWFNDTPGRIGRAQEAGYEHVKDKDGKNVSRIVGTAEGGGALTAFLMEIPQEWYDADMKLEQAIINEREDLMKRGKFEAPDQGYVPSQGIKIQQGN